MKRKTQLVVRGGGEAARAAQHAVGNGEIKVKRGLASPNDSQRSIQEVKSNLATSDSNPIPLNGAVPKNRKVKSVDSGSMRKETLIPSDLILVTTVDGKVHGINRTSGEWKWTMEGSGKDPLVQTYSKKPSKGPIYDNDFEDDSDDAKRQRKLHEERHALDKISYIVEPTGNGNLYVFTPEIGLQKLSHDMKQVVNMAPFSTDTEHPQFYTGSKKTNLFAVDANSGRVLRLFDHDMKCPNSFFDDWEEQCSDNVDTLPKSAIVIGRTDYTLNIFDESRRKVWNVTYNEYGPDSMNFGINNAYTRPIDDTYFLSNHEGILAALNIKDDFPQQIWQQTLPSPIVNIFEILRSSETDKPIVIKHPPPPKKLIPDDVSSTANRDGLSSVYVGNVDGNLFALSQENFPLAVLAKPPERIGSGGELGDSEEKEKSDSGCSRASPNYPQCLVGSHRLEMTPLLDAGDRPYPSIDGPSEPQIIALPPPEQTNPSIPRAPGLPGAPSREHNPLITLALFIFIAAVVYMRKKWKHGKHWGVNFNVNVFIGPRSNRNSIESTRSLLTDGDRDSRRSIEAGPSSIRKPPIELTDMSGKGKGRELPIKDEKVRITEIHDVDDIPRGGRRKRRGRGGKKKQAADEDGEGDEVNEAVDGDVPVGEDAVSKGQNGSSLSAGTASILNSRSPLQMGSLEVSDVVLGYGSHGTVVYRGTFEGRDVAVKRLLMDFYDVAYHEVTLLQESDEHPNVVRYYCKQQCDKFLYIALELCPASLYDVVERHESVDLADLVSRLDAKQVLSQMMAGVRFLHQMKIVHRDLKPQNILVAKRNIGGIRILISDFGLCKKLEADQSSFNNTAVNGGGTIGWRAPELLTGEVSAELPSSHDSGHGSGSTNNDGAGVSRRVTKAIDIFSAGCVFYYVLSGGEHPFGDRFSREVNIIQGRFNLSRLDGMGEEGTEAQDLVARMIAKDAAARPDADEILVHPYFWTAAQRLMFLQDASDRFEVEVRDPPSPLLQSLEKDATSIVGPDWHRRIDRMITDNLGKFRKYDGKLIRDLLRALRNKKHHYQDLPDHVKRAIGPIPDGFLNYFTRRFPGLLLHVYYVIAESDVRHEDSFQSYFKGV